MLMPHGTGGLQMKHTEAEILDALEVIKETCEDAVGCNECPFWWGDDEGCAFRMSPAEWELNNSVPTWRAFV